jgi:NADH-quinone oxidoreductase subunit A
LLTQYAYIALFSLVAIVFAVTMIALPFILNKIGMVRHHPSEVKNSTFECGMESTGKTHVRFNFRYYFYALLFVVMDVLVLFLYPWAVGMRDLGIAGLVVILVMFGLIVVGYVYAWKKKAFEWR